MLSLSYTFKRLSESNPKTKVFPWKMSEKRRWQKL